MFLANLSKNPHPDSDVDAGEELANLDGTLAFYFRYLRGGAPYR